MSMNPLFKKLLRISFIFFITLFLFGCSLFSPVKNDQTRYLLTQSPSFTMSKFTHPISILVMRPETVAVYDTTDMAYTIKPYQIAYFSQNVWAEKPSQMLHPLIVEALQNTYYFQAVITPPFVGQSDYILNTQILMLQQDFIQHPAILKLVVRAQLGKTSTNRIVATRQFIIYEPMLRRGPYAGVIAANRATAKLLTQLSQFCVENTSVHALVGAG